MRQFGHEDAVAVKVSVMTLRSIAAVAASCLCMVLTAAEVRPAATDDVLVKAVTYSGYQWLDLKHLWDTGYENKGGIVLFNERG